MVDIKKLISGFLVLAAIASSSALFLSSLLSSRDAAQANANPISQYPNISISNTPPPIPPNAFIEPLPEDRASLTSREGSSKAAPTGNLTEDFAHYFVRSTLEANPSGARVIDGQLTFKAPGIDSITSQFVNDYGQDISIPDWDKEIPPTMSIIDDYNVEDLAKYNEALNKIIDKNIIKTGLVSVSPNAPAVVIDLLYGSLGNTIKELAALRVPAPLAELHKNFLKLTFYQKNAALLVGGNDPLRASLILQAHEQKYNLTIQNLQEAVRKISEINTLSGIKNSSGVLSSVESIFGIPRAHALFFSIVFDPTIFARVVWQFLQDMLLQILKNFLIQTIQSRSLDWVRGSGNPLFVTDWKSYLGDVFNHAAGAAIEQIVPGACMPLQPLLRISLSPPPAPTTDFGFGSYCTLDRIVDNIREFYTNFSKGGWVGYSALAMPNNSFFGGLIEGADFRLQVAAEKREAAKNTAISGSGYTGTQLCPSTGGAPNRGRCPNGEDPITTTPGELASYVIQKVGVGSQVELIVNANNLAGVAATLAASLFEKLLIAGVGGLLGSASPTPPSPTLPPSPISCTPQSQQVNATGTVLVFTASGGSGNNFSYGWSAPNSTQTSGTGPSFFTSYNSQGNYTVTVTDGANSASCQVSIVLPTPTPTGTLTPRGTPTALTCIPSTQSVGVNVNATLDASGGTGNYTWTTAPGSGAVPSSGTGPTFTVIYASTGLKTVQLDDGVNTDTCTVIVQ